MLAEYKFPLEIIDKPSTLGFYHNNTVLILFAERADATEKEQLFTNPFWSYGGILELNGVQANMLPVSFGLGFGKSSKKETFLFISLNASFN